MSTSVLFAASLHSNAANLLVIVVLVVACIAVASIGKHMLADNPRGGFAILGLGAVALVLASTAGRDLLLHGATKIINAFVG